MRQIFLGLILGLSVAAPLRAEAPPPPLPTAQSLRAELPDWVEDMPAPAASPELLAAAQDTGEVFLLSDTQIRWKDGRKDTFGRAVIQIVTPDGVEMNRQITLEIDADAAPMRLIDLRVIRDGTAIVLTDQITPEITRRTTKAPLSAFDPMIFATYTIPDLQVGDVVDYATLLQAEPQLPGINRYVSLPMEWVVPVVLTRAVVHWPNDWRLNQAPLPREVVVTEGPGPEYTTRLEFQRLNQMPIPNDPHAPATAEQWVQLNLSADSDWSGINTEIAPHYRAAYSLPAEWTARLDAIRTRLPDREAQALAVLHLVQDKITSVKSSFGSNGVLARPPAEVIATGLGDAKDKALLLAVLLRHLEFNADVALTDLDKGATLPRHLPMLLAFDHVIVRLELDKETVVWLDPTLRHQGGTQVEWIAHLPYGNALPLKGGGQRQMEPIPADPAAIWFSAQDEHFRFTPFGVFLSVKATYAYGGADLMRALWARDSRDAIAARYLTGYQERIPGLIPLAPITMVDDPAQNQLITQETYYLSPLALRQSDLAASFPFVTENFAAALPMKLALPRKLPLANGPAGIYANSILITGAPPEFTPSESLSLWNRAFNFELWLESWQPGTVYLSWTYSSTGADIPPSAVEEVLAHRQIVTEKTAFHWDMRP